MTTPLTAPGQIVDVRPLGERLPGRETETLVRTDRLAVVRLVVPAGRQIPTHVAPGEITLQCLEGRVSVSARGQTQELPAGHLLHLSSGDRHALTGLSDSSVLLTILR